MLVVGGGGREHSLVWRLSQSDSTKHVFAAPGNPGTEVEKNVTNVALNVSKHNEVCAYGAELNSVYTWRVHTYWQYMHVHHGLPPPPGCSSSCTTQHLRT